MKTAGFRPQLAETTSTPMRKVSAAVVGLTLITMWYVKTRSMTTRAATPYCQAALRMIDLTPPIVADIDNFGLLDDNSRDA